MNICTISAANYLAQARVLADSFLDLHPTGTVHILVVDGTDDPPHRAGVRLYDGRSVFPDEADFLRMATMYDVVELSTAVKPAFLLHLLQQTGEPVTYLDPDILVVSSLQDVAEEADEHGLVLTPHLLQPMEVARRFDLNEISIAVAGTYNLGFASVSDGAIPFLRWWDERLRRWCVNQAADGSDGRSEMGRPRVRVLRRARPARPRLQRRLLERGVPAAGDDGGRAADGERRHAAALLPLQRLQPAPPAPALQVARRAAPGAALGAPRPGRDLRAVSRPPGAERLRAPHPRAVRLQHLGGRNGDRRRDPPCIPSRASGLRVGRGGGGAADGVGHQRRLPRVAERGRRPAA